MQVLATRLSDEHSLVLIVTEEGWRLSHWTRLDSGLRLPGPSLTMLTRTFATVETAVAFFRTVLPIRH